MISKIYLSHYTIDTSYTYTRSCFNGISSSVASRACGDGLFPEAIMCQKTVPRKKIWKHTNSKTARMIPSHDCDVTVHGRVAASASERKFRENNPDVTNLFVHSLSIRKFYWLWFYPYWCRDVTPGATPITVAIEDMYFFVQQDLYWTRSNTNRLTYDLRDCQMHECPLSNCPWQ